MASTMLKFPISTLTDFNELATAIEVVDTENKFYVTSTSDDYLTILISSMGTPTDNTDAYYPGWRIDKTMDTAITSFGASIDDFKYVSDTDTLTRNASNMGYQNTGICRYDYRDDIRGYVHKNYTNGIIQYGYLEYEERNGIETYGIGFSTGFNSEPIYHIAPQIAIFTGSDSNKYVYYMNGGGDGIFRVYDNQRVEKARARKYNNFYDLTYDIVILDKVDYGSFHIPNLRVIPLNYFQSIHFKMSQYRQKNSMWVDNYINVDDISYDALMLNTSTGLGNSAILTPHNAEE